MAEDFSKLKGEDRRWRIERAADTLREYTEIMGQPKLMEEAQKELDKQQKDIENTKKYIEICSSKSSMAKT